VPQRELVQEAGVAPRAAEHIAADEVIDVITAEIGQRDRVPAGLTRALAGRALQPRLVPDTVAADQGGGDAQLWPWAVPKCGHYKKRVRGFSHPVATFYEQFQEA
jgi:hypothetical protein